MAMSYRKIKHWELLDSSSFLYLFFYRKGIRTFCIEYFLALLGYELGVLVSSVRYYYLALFCCYIERYFAYFIYKVIRKKFHVFSVYKRIRHYRGIRLLLDLPLRGQRTYTNRRTRRRFKVI